MPDALYGTPFHESHKAHLGEFYRNWSTALCRCDGLWKTDLPSGALHRCVLARGLLLRQLIVPPTCTLHPRCPE